MKQKLPYATMHHLASTLCERFNPYCTRIEIAGSIRRKKPECGDIELVAVPTPELYHRLDELLAAGTIQHVTKKRWGEKLRSFLITTVRSGQAVQVDLFLQPSPATWGVNFMIRTGSGDFSHRMVTSRSAGGWMPDCYRVKDARVWHGERALATPEEGDVFRLWGMDLVPPELRTEHYKPVRMEPPPVEQLVSGDVVTQPVPLLDWERVVRESAAWPTPSYGGREGAQRAAAQAIAESVGRNGK